jgi:hypothetical protein
MNKDTFRYIKGIARRWCRKKFHKGWDVIEHGLMRNADDGLENILKAVKKYYSNDI